MTATLLVFGVIVLLIDISHAEDARTGNTWDEPERWWTFQGLESPGDDFTAVIPTLADVTSRYSMHIGLSVGMAAREVAGGARPQRVLYPRSLDTMLVPGRWNNGEYAPALAQFDALTGYGSAEVDYDPIVDTATVEKWATEATVLEYPWNVRAVLGSRPSGIVVLYYDPTERIVYVVPQALSPVAAGMSPPQEDSEK